MIKVQDHQHSSIGFRNQSMVMHEVDKLDEFDLLAIYFDYMIDRIFNGYKPVSFERFKSNPPFSCFEDNVYRWYYLYFKKA